MARSLVAMGRDLKGLGHAQPPLHEVRAIVKRALDEDIAWGDVTTDNSVPADQRSRAALLVKQDGVLCGGRVFAEALALVDPAAKEIVEFCGKHDEDVIAPDFKMSPNGDAMITILTLPNGIDPFRQFQYALVGSFQDSLLSHCMAPLHSADQAGIPSKQC
jgi:hypothetical protein